MMRDPGQVYVVAKSLANACQEHGCVDIAEQLRQALMPESSALETLGRIRKVILQNRVELERLEDRKVLDEVVKYIDRIFGRG